jgi:UDPglucose 6-dehydrogenase
LRILEAVVDELAAVMVDDQLVVTKSTVPVGTALALRERLRSRGCGVGVVSNPEFLAEGSAVADFLRAERIVIGAFEDRDADIVGNLYAELPGQIVKTDPVSAELVKYAANAYLATRLTFANAIANISEEVGADALEVLQAVGMDRRIGPHFMHPGPGYGGSCFPKDTRALLSITDSIGYPFPLLQAVVSTDAMQRARILDRTERLLGGCSGKKVAMWGAAFKARTDDTRESPALILARGLIERGATVVVTDPEAETHEFSQFDDPVDAARDADLVIVATEWPEFRRVDFSRLAEVMRGRTIYDVRNLLDPDVVREAGLEYIGLGRPNV